MARGCPVLDLPLGSSSHGRFRAPKSKQHRQKVKQKKTGARREARVRPDSRSEAPAPGEETPCSEGPSEPSLKTGGEGGRLAGGDPAGLEGGEGGALTGEGSAGDIPAGKGSRAPERKEREE